MNRKANENTPNPCRSVNKAVIILSGVSGSGKSFVADLLAESFSELTVICCADDYFTDEDGVYNFNPAKIGKAHKECQDKFLSALLDFDTKNIILANTNTSRKDFKYYQNLCETHKATCVRLVVDNIHNTEDVHNVPQEVRANQFKRLVDSLSFSI